MSDISPWVTHRHLTMTKTELVISLPTSTPKWSSSSTPYLTWCGHHLPCPVDSLKYFPNLRFCVAMSTSLVSPSLCQTKLFKDKGSALAICVYPLNHDNVHNTFHILKGLSNTSRILEGKHDLCWICNHLTIHNRKSLNLEITYILETEDYQTACFWLKGEWI